MQNKSIMPGKIWLDSDGNPIQAHGGCVLYDEGIYYWFGENKAGPTKYKNKEGSWHRVDVIGISCYSSIDLINWKNEGVVLPADQMNPDSDLHPSKVLERPKVIHNAHSGQYVLITHIDTADYFSARVGFAVSNKPAGPYRYLGSIQPNGNDSRDMTVFCDDDDKAYLYYSSDWNKTLRIVQLDETYLHPVQEETQTFPNLSREAPAVFKCAGKYYLLSSACTGWEPNQAQIAIADTPLGPWEMVGNPCVGQDAELTFHAQSAFVFPVIGKQNAFIAMFDRWNQTNLRESRYVWLPVLFEEGNITIPWIDEWNLSIFDRYALTNEEE